MLLDAIASNSARVAPCGEEANSIVPQFKLMSLSATGRAKSGQPFTLTDNDFKHWIVRQRLEAKKRLHLKQLKAEDDLAPAKLDELLTVSLAEEAWQITERGAKPVRVIVFCNKRKVAEATRKALEQLAKTADQTDIKDRTELFVGGRRVYERETAAARLRELGFIAGSKPPLNKPVFLFATSAGEVGVDLDADHMVSDLVEWERMIQRLGRVNRRGEGDAQVIVLVEPDPKPDKAAKTALAKNPDEREGKDTKIIEAYQRKVEVTRAKRAPFDFLPLNDDKSVNASPGAIRDLKFRASGDEKLQAILVASCCELSAFLNNTCTLQEAISLTHGAQSGLKVVEPERNQRAIDCSFSLMSVFSASILRFTKFAKGDSWQQRKRRKQQSSTCPKRYGTH